MDVESSIVLGPKTQESVFGSGVEGCLAASIPDAGGARKEALSILNEILEEGNPDMIRHRIANFIRRECVIVKLPTELRAEEVQAIAEKPRGLRTGL